MRTGTRPRRADPLTGPIIAGAILLASCTGGVATTAPAPSALAIPTSAAPSPLLTPVPTGPSPAGGLAVSWAAVPAFGIKPHGGFEHAFGSSERGAMILIRNLEGDPTTIVATSADGGQWAVREYGSDVLPFGRVVDGATDWTLVVPGVGQRDPLRVVASSDGLRWEARGALPAAIGAVHESVAAGERIVLCGSSGGERDVPSCATSPDGGRTWDVANELTGLVGARSIRTMASLAGGFLVLVEAEEAGRSNAIVSTDGSTWKAAPEPVESSAFSSVALGDGVVVSVGPEDATPRSVLLTADGREWERALFPATTSAWFSVHPIGSAVLAVGVIVPPEGAESVTDLLASLDGRTWSAVDIPAALRTWQNPEFLSVAGGIVAVGDRVVGENTVLVGRVIGADAAGG